MNLTTDHQIIQQVLGGDTQRFGILVERYEGFVFTIIIRMLRSKEAAEEVAQDTFIKAYTGLSGFRGESKFSSWLYQIAYRKALDYIKANKKHRAVSLVEEITEDNMAAIENALDLMIADERKQMISDAIKQLDAAAATIVTLYYYEDASVREIATIVSLSEDNVKVKLYRSRKKLYALLKKSLYMKPMNAHGKA
jgi:RNA polymerase sigma-70 factor (ECF subfamily)